MAKATDEITTYAYANNNPVMMNDPMGDYAAGKDMPKWIRDMQADYKAWHDSRYGNNLPDRGWDFGSGAGELGVGGGGGMSDFEFWSTYEGMKIRQGNDPRAKYGYNKWGEFGYWTRESREFHGYLEEAHGTDFGKEQSLKGVGVASDRRVWVSFSGFGSGWPFPWLSLGGKGGGAGGRGSGSKKSNPGDIGTGLQFSVGMGIGKHGTQLTAGAFSGVTSRVGYLFFTVTEPDPKSDDFSFDFSASAQVLGGYSNTGKFNLSGTGRSYGYGFDPVSLSYSTDNLLNPTYHIVGVGPSVGVKYSGSAGKSTTYVLPYVKTVLFGGMMWRF